MKATEELPALWGRINEASLAALTGAHITTARRWKRLRRLPQWLESLVYTLAEGWLCRIHKDWRGWMIRTRDGVLVTPEGITVTQGQIRALPQLYALRDALQAELRMLRELRSAPAARACNRPPRARPGAARPVAAERPPAPPGAPTLPRARS